MPAAFNECKALTTVTFEKESQLKRIGGINHKTNGGIMPQERSLNALN